MNVTNVEVLRQLREVTLRIFRTHSLEEMRTMIFKELPSLCDVQSISIQSQSPAVQKGVYAVALSGEIECHLCFYKNQVFSKGNKKFLTQVAKAIHINFQKIETHDQLCSLKEQWKSAFNAISKPICLTDENFFILSTNKAFMKQISTYNKPPKNIYGKDCFSVFFGSPLVDEEQAQLLQTKIFKKIPHLESTFELHCQSFLKERGGVIRLIIFTDRTQQMDMERKISRLSDKAEMGIIASSIAHELNNPLGGIQALLQVSSVQNPQTQIKIKEILLAVQRCQKIVSHLLNSHSIKEFSHIPEVQPLEDTASP